MNDFDAGKHVGMCSWSLDPALLGELDSGLATGQVEWKVRDGR